MSVVGTLTMSAKFANSDTGGGAVTVGSAAPAATVDGSVLLKDETITGAQTDFAITYAFTRSKVKQLFWVFDKAVTVKTNSSGSPQETLTFPAGVPLVWDDRMPKPVIGGIFGGDVTSLFITTPSDTRCRIYTLLAN